MYVPCATNFSKLGKDLDTLNRLATRYDSCFIGGNFNARSKNWDTVDNLTGCALNHWLQQTVAQLEHIVPNKPTREDSYLDHFLISNDLLIRSNGEENFTTKTRNSFSDHLAVEIQIHLRNSLEFLTVPQTHFNYKKIDWQNFQHVVKTKLNSLNIVEDKNLTKGEIDIISGH
jgi:hypothetical protein